jgi:hypothetical protein
MMQHFLAPAARDHRVREHVRVLRRADATEHHSALRLSPRSFARLIGEPLNAAENSSAVIWRGL